MFATVFLAVSIVAPAAPPPDRPNDKDVKALIEQLPNVGHLIGTTYSRGGRVQSLRYHRRRRLLCDGYARHSF